MSALIIKGGKKLKGDIVIGGCKNSSLPILAAALLTRGTIILDNLPRLLDVFNLIKILEALGVKATWQNDHQLKLDTTEIEYQPLLIEEVKKLRGSILLLGSLLARFRKAELSLPGGDIIGARPLDAHFEAFKALGIEIDINNTITASFSKLKTKEVVLTETSVTATENLLIFCSLLTTPIKLKLAATEPSVQTLGAFLQKLGVKIEGLGTPFLTIRGHKTLKKQVHFSLPSDPIEIATFTALAAATKSQIQIVNSRPGILDALFLTMRAFNIKFKLRKTKLSLYPSNLKATRIQTGLYPKFLSDMHPPFGVLATQARGVTLIHDWLYENRFGYLNELVLMGANAQVLDPHRALIIGPTPLIGKEIRSLDIRSGAALVIAGLVAHGTTIIQDAEKIDRGYENLDLRLRHLGAIIERIA